MPTSAVGRRATNSGPGSPNHKARSLRDGTCWKSGWRLSARYREYDAERRFAVTDIKTSESPLCRSGEVLQGLIKPHQCSAFGKQCTPRNPLGATMVSSEGACAAYYAYRRLDLVQIS